MARRRHSAFTLVELLTVAFIIAIMIGLLLPALQSINKSAMNSKTQRILETIRQGISSYLNDFPGQYPPGEPDMVNGNIGYYTVGYGGQALLTYLNGTDGTSGLSANGTENGATGGGAGFTKVYPARVQGVRISGAGGAFLDAWGYGIEYFVAYKDRAVWHAGSWPRANPGTTCADVYPRACNVNLTAGTGDYTYNNSTGQVAISGLNLHINAAKWLDGYAPAADGSYPSGWQYHMVPVNMGNYILASMGADGLWGTSDDQGDVTTWGN